MSRVSRMHVERGVHLGDVHIVTEAAAPSSLSFWMQTALVNVQAEARITINGVEQTLRSSGTSRVRADAPDLQLIAAEEYRELVAILKEIGLVAPQELPPTRESAR